MTFYRMDAPLIPVSWGEVFDKLSILDLKRERLTDPAQRANVEREYALIQPALAPINQGDDQLQYFVNQLHAVNGQLWDIENDKRKCEKEQRFDAMFIQLARQVYLLNDLRAALKKAINARLGSEIVEEKCHAA